MDEVQKIPYTRKLANSIFIIVLLYIFISEVSSFTWANGTTGESVDAWFANDQMITVTRLYDIDIDPLAFLLPQLKGAGEIPDPFIAMSVDETLFDLVQDFTIVDPAAGTDLGVRITEIIYRWAGVENVLPGSRGPYVDAQHLESLEAFMGQPFPQISTVEFSANGFKEAWAATRADTATMSKLGIPEQVGCDREAVNRGERI